MPYVELDGSGNVVGTYVDPQPGRATTFLADTDPKVVAFNDNPLTHYQNAVAAGLQTTWTTSTQLNGTYPVDQGIQIRMLAERLSVAVNSTFTNGTNTLTWYNTSGSAHSLTTAQANALLKACWAYLTALWVAYNTAIAGGTPSWPSNFVTIAA